jgi:hypothetical protein
LWGISPCVGISERRGWDGKERAELRRRGSSRRRPPLVAGVAEEEEGRGERLERACVPECGWRRLEDRFM